MKSTSAEIAANAALVLLGVACALLDRQTEAQAAAFTDEGGASRSGCTAFAVKGENMALNESIVVIADEARRSQYGFGGKVNARCVIESRTP